MTLAEGIVVAITAMSLTFIVIGLVGLAIVTIKFQEERSGTGCRSAGCRRSRRGHGRTNGPRVAETARGDFNQED